MADEMSPDEMRIDEMARRAGVATTTIRLYQHRGLLPGPRLEGRTGWYGPAHLDRLRLIARLQGDGHSLAGIARLVESWERGRDLDALVGEQAGLSTLFGSAREVVLTPAELAARLPVGAMEPATMARAVEVGLVALTDDGRIRVPDGRFVETGPALAALGVPLDAILDEWEQLAAQTDEIARRFLQVFEDHLVPDGVDLDHLDDEQLTALGAQLARLHQLAGQVVQASLDASIARLARARLARLVAPGGE
ncbi:MAG TPA: MerR family transcriptional regulator [Iamia sp.]